MLTPRSLHGLLVVALVLTSQANAAEFASLKLGFGGNGKVGKWLPIQTSATGLPPSESVQLRAVFSDPRGDTCIEIVDEATVDSKGRVELSGYFRTGRLEGTGTIQVAGSQDEKILCQQSITHGNSVVLPDKGEDPKVISALRLQTLNVPFLLTIGDVAGIKELLRNADNFSADTSLLQGVQVDTLTDLPAAARGLQAIDILLLTDEFETTTEQATAIREWVLDGGFLVVSAGQAVTTLTQTPLGKWLSQKFEIRSEPISVEDLSGVQSYVSGAKVLRTNYYDVPMAVMNSDQTVVEVASLDGTIVGTQSVGAGVVKFVSVGVNQKPLSAWPSLAEFYEVLLFGKKLSRQATQDSRRTRISQSGISDLATQMMATVDAVPETGRWSTWAIMAIIVLYLLLIGPVDYLLVTYVLKRPHFTWLTFPLMIAAGVFGLHLASESAGATQLNQLHLVDVVPMADGSQTCSQSWMSVSSPNTMRGDIEAAIALSSLGEGSTKRELDLTWSGRPEDIYGGMYRVGGIGIGRQSYVHRNSAREKLSGVPLLTNGSRELLANWKVDSQTALVDSELSVSGYGLLNGEFSHSLPFAISDWAIMHGNRVYRSRLDSKDGAIAPGITWSSEDPDVYASDLKSFLNASRLVKEERKSSGNRGMTQVITPYDAESTDPLYVVTMATFYQASGGSKYVGLSNSILGRVELSDTIRRNHAVLIGLAESPATDLSIDGSSLKATRSKTIVRLLLPIDRQPAKASASISDDD